MRTHSRTPRASESDDTGQSYTPGGSSGYLLKELQVSDRSTAGLEALIADARAPVSAKCTAIQSLYDLSFDNTARGNDARDFIKNHLQSTFVPPAVNRISWQMPKDITVKGKKVNYVDSKGKKQKVKTVDLSKKLLGQENQLTSKEEALGDINNVLAEIRKAHYSPAGINVGNFDGLLEKYQGLQVNHPEMIAVLKDFDESFTVYDKTQQNRLDYEDSDILAAELDVSTAYSSARSLKSSENLLTDAANNLAMPPPVEEAVSSSTIKPSAAPTVMQLAKAKLDELDDLADVMRYTRNPQEITANNFVEVKILYDQIMNFSDDEANMELSLTELNSQMLKLQEDIQTHSDADSKEVKALSSQWQDIHTVLEDASQAELDTLPNTVVATQQQLWDGITDFITQQVATVGKDSYGVTLIDGEQPFQVREYKTWLDMNNAGDTALMRKLDICGAQQTVLRSDRKLIEGIFVEAEKMKDLNAMRVLDQEYGRIVASAGKGEEDDARMNRVNQKQGKVLDTISVEGAKGDFAEPLEDVVEFLGHERASELCGAADSLVTSDRLLSEELGPLDVTERFALGLSLNQRVEALEKNLNDQAAAKPSTSNR